MKNVKIFQTLFYLMDGFALFCKELFCQLRKCLKSQKKPFFSLNVVLGEENWELCFVDKIQISDSELNQSIYWSVHSNDGAT